MPRPYHRVATGVAVLLLVSCSRSGVDEAPSSASQTAAPSSEADIVVTSTRREDYQAAPAQSVQAMSHAEVAAPPRPPPPPPPAPGMKMQRMAVPVMAPQGIMPMP